MIYYKISFLIVLISVVCFSADFDPEDEQSRIQSRITTCDGELQKIFGPTNSRQLCLQKAIKELKLFGNYADSFEFHVNRYYEAFHEYVKLDTVVLPDIFCSRLRPVVNIQDCEEKIKIFTVIPPEEDSEVPVYGDLYGSRETTILKKALFGPKFPFSRGGSKFPFSRGGPKDASSSKNPKEPSSSGSSYDANDVRMIIVKNALYFHVTVDQINRFQPPEEDAKKYFHEKDSYGYKYLLEIARIIKFDKGKFPNRTEFCFDFYVKHEGQKYHR